MKKKDKENMSNFNKALEDALNAVTLFEVTHSGKLLESKRTGYIETYHDADSSGGMWKQAEIWEYEGKKYLIVNRCYDFPSKREICVVFREYEEEDV